MRSSRRCSACGRDVAELETHRCEVETVVDGPSPRGTPEDRERVFGPRAGEVLAGRYTIIDRIAEGGSGIVFRAWDRQLEVQIALKVLLPSPPTDTQIKRLKREIRVTRDIDHPNVSRVFDIAQEGTFTFLTMRWLDGTPLASRVRRDGPLPPPVLARLARGLVAALAAAHRIGVVHRDVKPGNVLVSEDGEPALLDFGIATDEGTSPGALARRGERITLAGEIPGTPAFMAPEQLRGEATTPAVDVWALALTIAYAATGDIGRPVDQERAFGTLPPALGALLGQCLHEDPAKRPRDATALLEAVAGAEPHGRSHRGRWIAALVLVAGIAVGGVALLAPPRETVTPAPPLVAVSPLDNRTGDPDLGWLEHGVSDLLVARLEGSGSVRIASDEAGRRRAARVVGRIVREGDAPVIRLDLLSPDGSVRASSRIANPTGDSLFDGVDAAAERILASLGTTSAVRRGRRPKATRPTDSIAAYGHWAKAQDLVRQHRGRDALEEIRQATQIDPRFALAQLQRYVLAAADRHGPRAEADSALEAAAENRSRLPPGPRELLESVLEARAAGDDTAGLDRLRTYLRAHPPDSTLYRMAVRLHAEIPDRLPLVEEWLERIPDDPEAHNQLGYLLLRMDDLDGAERAFREYLGLAPEDANAHDSFADLLRDRGRFADALRSYDRAVELRPTFANAHAGAAEVLLVLDDLAAADARAALARAHLTADSRDNRTWVRLHAAIPLVSGDVGAALRRLDEIERHPEEGMRALLASEYEAIVRGLQGDAPGARRAAAEADRLHRLYHGADAGLPSLGPYVAGLAAHRRRDRRGLAAASEALTELRFGPTDRVDEARRGIVEGLRLSLEGDPSAAAERLVVPRETLTDGSSFLAALERARALVAAGRGAEAKPAYEEALARRERDPATAEAAFEYRACTREAERLP